MIYTVKRKLEYSCCIFGYMLECKLTDTLKHELIGIVRDGENVRWSFNPLFASVSLYNHCIIHREPLVGIHSDAEQPRVCLMMYRGLLVLHLHIALHILV